LDYGVDIKVKAGSTLAKSKASQEATLIDIIQKTPASTRLNDADVMDRFLKLMDCEVLRDGSSVHRDKARNENELFTDIGRMGPESPGSMLPVVCDEDDHTIHIAEHTRDLVEKFSDIQSDEFELTIRKYHIELHKMYQKEKTGDVPAGSAAQFSSVYKQASAAPPTDLGDLAAKKQAMDQAKAPPPGPVPGPGQNPGAPSQAQPGGQAKAQAAGDMGTPQVQAPGGP